MQNSYSRSGAFPAQNNWAHRPAYRASAGFTLVELVVVTAIAAILMSVAVPAVGSFRAKLDVRTATDSLVSSLLFTRREAIMRNTRVVMCKSSDGRECATTNGWEQGWIVFLDTNGNRMVHSEESEPETVLLRQAATPTVNIKLKDSSSIENFIAYNSLGLTFQNASMAVCTMSGPATEARKVVLSAGRPRVERLRASDAQDGLTC